ncbi:uncharacterized protein LOC126853689 [Cataglyphis hispanica]|uniref:uncharacterized protein LOC126853689 n=1 Tax=Cataglyphis hispanica TaxID=1086592 RepID=UPI00217F98E5|nr:uncharacterized protein LOC126853689 [Cataglyphis hispanica]
MENKSVSRSVEDEVKQIQAYLRKYENDDNLEILEAMDRPGSKPGDNYTSVLIKTKLVGRRGDGSPYTKSIITKSIVEGRAISGLIDLHTLFRMEAHVYQKILPVLGSFGPRCIYADRDTIIMEDLAEKGYVNCERRDFLDLDHTIFTLKKLAKFHASGLAVKMNDPQLFDELTESLEEVVYNDTSEKSVMRLCTEMCIKSAVKSLEVIEPRTQELQAVIDYIASYVDKTYDTMCRMINAPKQKYHTICHGDPWINNMLFLHDNEGKIIDLKMVDYQIIRHTSVSTDIHYLIYTSVQSSLIERSYESLIRIYHSEFLKELRRLNVDEKILTELDREWLETELRAYAFYGGLTGCFMANPILAEEEDVLQFEKMAFGPDNPFWSTDVNIMNISQKKLDRVKCITCHLYRRYSLGIIDDDLEPISITT